MDGNTAAAEQLAARTKMDCITHTIFLAGGAFLEPIVTYSCECIIVILFLDFFSLMILGGY